MKSLDKSSYLILVTLFILIVLIGFLYIKPKVENFVIQPCYTCGNKWDDCYDKCLNIYDQEKSEICKQQCNKYLF